MTSTFKGMLDAKGVQIYLDGLLEMSQMVECSCPDQLPSAAESVCDSLRPIPHPHLAPVDPLSPRPALQGDSPIPVQYRQMSGRNHTRNIHTCLRGAQQTYHTKID